MRKTVKGHWLATNLRHVYFYCALFPNGDFKVHACHQKGKPDPLCWLKISVASLIFLEQHWLRPAEDLPSPSQSLLPFWQCFAWKEIQQVFLKHIAFCSCICFCMKEVWVASDVASTFEPLELYFCSHRNSLCWVFLTKHSPTVLIWMVQCGHCAGKPRSEIVQVCCSSQGKCQ